MHVFINTCNKGCILTATTLNPDVSKLLIACSINLLAVGSDTPHAAAVTLIGEQVFIQSGEQPERQSIILLPLIIR